jgi:hypothetical protein
MAMYRVGQRGPADGLSLQNTDPDDPPPGPPKRPGLSRLQPVELQNTDPDDPPPGPPKNPGLSRLQPLQARGKGMRRDRPAKKTAKGRTGSRRR